MSESDFDNEILGHKNPLLRRVLDPGFACSRCHTMSEYSFEVIMAHATKISLTENAQDDHDILTRFLEEVSHGQAVDGISREEIKKMAGQLIVDNLEDLDQLLGEARTDLETLVDSCSGPVSISRILNGRMIGIIACGSRDLQEGDLEHETVHVTRIPVN